MKPSKSIQLWLFSETYLIFQVIYFQALVLVYISFQIIRSIFFGDLRAAEAEVIFV